MGVLDNIANLITGNVPEIEAPPKPSNDWWKKEAAALYQQPEATTAPEEPVTEKTIATALDSVGVLEGGYVNHPSDPGGETNHGVTIGFLRSVRPSATSEDLKALTKEDARALFDEHFVRRPGFDQLPDVVQAEVIALGINAGVPRAIKVLQKAAGVKQDGHLGPATLNAVQSLSNEEIKAEVDGFYKRLVERNPKLKVFLKGWLKRSAHMNAIPEDTEEDEPTVDVYADAKGRKFRLDGNNLVQVD